jgi:hypothetical protein
LCLSLCNMFWHRWTREHAWGHSSVAVYTYVLCYRYLTVSVHGSPRIGTPVHLSDHWMLPHVGQ